MSGKHQLDNSVTNDPTDPTDSKKTKLGGVATATSLERKENKQSSPLKKYPKRSRTLSAKSLALLQEASKATTPTHAEEMPVLEQLPVKPNTCNLTVHSNNDQAVAAKSNTVKVKTKTKPATAQPNTNDEKPKSTATKAKTEKSKSAAGKNTSEKAKTISIKAKEAANKRKLPKTVDKILESMGISAHAVSRCVKSAMCKGFIALTGDPLDLEEVVFEGSYDDHTFKVLLKDVLYQPDNGSDYEDGSEGATATCTCCRDDDWQCKAYLTRICQKQPELDCGKFHNHCGLCKGFGVCMNDYRMSHCHKCNKHWFEGMKVEGLSGFPCDNCKRIRQQQRGLAGLFMGSDSDSEDGGLFMDSDSENGNCVIS